MTYHDAPKHPGLICRECGNHHRVWHYNGLDAGRLLCPACDWHAELRRRQARRIVGAYLAEGRTPRVPGWAHPEDVADLIAEATITAIPAAEAARLGLPSLAATLGAPA